VALPNFASYFKKCADEEFEHAQKFMKYQNQRGGTIVLSDIKKPKDDNKWGKGIDAIRSALDLERDVNDKLHKLHKVADSHNDYELADFVDEFLHEQVEAIRELTGHLTNLKRLGAENDENFNGHGEYHFERKTLS
jgi:ferritin heavy chain